MGNWWILTEESIKTIASYAPPGFPVYEGNEKLWAAFANALDDNGYLEAGMVKSVKSSTHPDNLSTKSA